MNTTLKTIWRKMRNKAYREAFVQAHVSNTIAAQIVSLREAAGWTQTDLAKKAGTGQSRISALEDPNNTNMEIATLRRLAAAFDVGLTVRFVPFSELARWSSYLVPENFVIPTFANDNDFATHVLARCPETAHAIPPAIFRGSRRSPE